MKKTGREWLAEVIRQCEAAKQLMNDNTISRDMRILWQGHYFMCCRLLEWHDGKGDAHVPTVTDPYLPVLEEKALLKT